MANKDQEAKSYSYDQRFSPSSEDSKKPKSNNTALIGYGLAFGLPIVGVSIPILIGKSLSGKAKAAYLSTAEEKAKIISEIAYERARKIEELKQANKSRF